MKMKKNGCGLFPSWDLNHTHSLSALDSVSVELEHGCYFKNHQTTNTQTRRAPTVTGAVGPWPTLLLPAGAPLQQQQQSRVMFLI